VNKKGVAQIKGVLDIMIAILVLLGFIHVLDDIGKGLSELDEHLCIDLESKAEICFVNESGIRITGNFNDTKIFLDTEGLKEPCLIKPKTYQYEKVCEREFGYLYNNKNFNLEIYKNKNLIKIIPKSKVYHLLSLLVKNKKGILSKPLKNSNQVFLVIEGIEWLQENWKNLY